MPDKLENLMLARPVKVSGEVQYPTTPAPKGPMGRFMGTLLGIDDQEPGDLPSALGAAANLVPFGAARKLGKGVIQGLEEGESLPRMLFNHAVDDATENSRTRWQRVLGNKRVGAAYNNLLTQNAIDAPSPKEAEELSQAVAARKASGITPKPTGMDTAKHQTNIINKLMSVGYKPTPEDIGDISKYVQEASLRTSDQLAPRGTGDYVRYIKGAITRNSPLKHALQSVPSWADGQTVSRNWIRK